MEKPALQSTFNRLFPPPRFLKMPAAGIDISDEGIRFVQLKETGHGLVVDIHGEHPLGKGVVVAGEVQNPAELKKALKAICDQYGFSFVAASLPEEKAYVVRLRIPNMRADEIRGNLELQFEEQVPLPVDQAVFDFDIIKKDKNHIEVALSALPRQTIGTYLSAFKDTGLVPITFEIESEAIARAVVPRGDKGTFMIVDFENTKTGISIVSEGVVRFTASLQVGGGALREAVEKKTGLGPEEANRLLKGKEVDSQKKQKDFFEAAVPVLSTLRDEINKHFVYWQTHQDQYGNPRSKIEKLILCGEDAIVGGLVDYLSSSLRVSSQLADVVRNMNASDKYVPEIDYTDSFKYTTAVGLALMHPR